MENKWRADETDEYWIKYKILNQNNCIPNVSFSAGILQEAQIVYKKLHHLVMYTIQHKM